MGFESCLPAQAGIAHFEDQITLKFYQGLSFVSYKGESLIAIDIFQNMGNMFIRTFFKFLIKRLGGSLNNISQRDKTNH